MGLCAPIVEKRCLVDDFPRALPCRKRVTQPNVSGLEAMVFRLEVLCVDVEEALTIADNIPYVTTLADLCGKLVA